MNTEKQLEDLKGIIRDLESVIVAFSGGVDSALLLAVAHDVLGSERCLAVTGISPSLAPEEYDDARAVAEQIGATWIAVETDEINDPDYQRNDANRCYYCKRELFTRLRSLADERGYAYVLDGFNADDVGDWRPGEQAGRERGVRSPLKEAEIGKEAIREMSRMYGLSTAEKQSFACLASRLPYGTSVTPERLEQVARAETALRNEDFGTFRVRYHGDTARLELGAEELARISDSETAARLISAIRSEGFDHVAVDLSGFRSGSQNEKSGDESLLQLASDRVILRRAGLENARTVGEGKMIRLIVSADELARIWDADTRATLVDGFRELGYVYVAVDLTPLGSSATAEVAL